MRGTSGGENRATGCKESKGEEASNGERSWPEFAGRFLPVRRAFEAYENIGSGQADERVSNERQALGSTTRLCVHVLNIVGGVALLSRYEADKHGRAGLLSGNKDESSP